MRRAVIVDGVRTANGRHHGGLSGWHPSDLVAEVLAALVHRNAFDPALVDHVLLGCVMQVGNQSLNLARNAVLAAGWPDTVPATTVECQGASSLQAVHFAAQGVMAGAYDLVVAAGAEVMSTTPMGSSLVPGSTPFGPRMIERYRPAGGLVPLGAAAELLAERYGLGRGDLDAFAATSHHRAAAASTAGRFEAEIVAVAGKRWDRETGQVLPTAAPVDHDECVDAGVTVASLAGARPAFRPDGVVTTANSAPIADGVAAVLLAGEDTASALGLRALADLRAFGAAAADPLLALTGPIAATTQVLHRGGLTIGRVERIEVDESFAPVVLAWMAEHGADPARVNVNGGAIALGRPLGAAGARQLVTLVHELGRSGADFGLVTAGDGGGTAAATLVARV